MEERSKGGGGSLAGKRAGTAEGGSLRLGVSELGVLGGDAAAAATPQPPRIPQASILPRFRTLHHLSSDHRGLLRLSPPFRPSSTPVIIVFPSLFPTSYALPPRALRRKRPGGRNYHGRTFARRALSSGTVVRGRLTLTLTVDPPPRTTSVPSLSLWPISWDRRPTKPFLLRWDSHFRGTCTPVKFEVQLSFIRCHIIPLQHVLHLFTHYSSSCRSAEALKRGFSASGEVQLCYHRFVPQTVHPHTLVR
jgi:hypothetical protein